MILALKYDMMLDVLTLKMHVCFKITCMYLYFKFTFDISDSFFKDSFTKTMLRNKHRNTLLYVNFKSFVHLNIIFMINNCLLFLP